MMILTVENTCGDKPCSVCDNLQETVTQPMPYGRPVNLKQVHYFPPAERIRLCGTCAERLLKDLRRAHAL